MKITFGIADTGWAELQGEMTKFAKSVQHRMPKRRPKQPKKMAQPKRPLTNADAGRLVRKAAEFLDDTNWGRSSLHSTMTYQAETNTYIQEDTYCVAGALNRTFCGNPELTRDRVEQIPLLKLTYNLLDEFFDAPIERWNDVVALDKDEVIQKLHKFADEHDPKRI